MPGNQAVTKIDAHVSARLRVARIESGETQTSAAEALGITFQQIQKYEKGSNRIAAGRLFELAKIYGKPIQWFFPENSCASLEDCNRS